MVAPFAGNNMLVLYNCPTKQTSKYYVQVMHNEVPVPLPVSYICDFVLNFSSFELDFDIIASSLCFALLIVSKLIYCIVQGCDGSDFCSFEVFKVLLLMLLNSLKCLS